MENRALGGHIISFSAGNTLFCRKRPRPDLSGEALAAPSPACVRSVVPRVDPFGFRIAPFGFRIAPFGSCMIPLRPAPSLSRPSSRRHDCHSSIPVPASPTPVLASLRQPLLPPGRAAKETGTKKSAFFWSFRKIFTTFTTYCSDNLISAPQRFARRIRLSSHPGNSDDG